MYYYIFDVRQCKNKSQAERIKDFLAEIGISGEYVYPSQARTAKELVKDALERHFSTIVAIGADTLINQVASQLVGESAAFGFIPLNASASVNTIVNGYDWRQAANNLRYRKIHEVMLGRFENGEHFLTETSLSIGSPVNLTLEFDEYIAQSRTKSLTIYNLLSDKHILNQHILKISFISEAQESGSLLNRFFHYFENKPINSQIKQSQIYTHRVRVFSHKNLSFLINNQPIAETPQLISQSSKPLRLIIARDFLAKN